MNQLALNVHAIIHAGQQHRLVAQRDTRTGQFIGRLSQFQADFIGVVNVNIHPQGMVLLNCFAEFIGNALRQEDRYTAADADDIAFRERSALDRRSVQIHSSFQSL